MAVAAGVGDLVLVHLGGLRVLPLKVHATSTRAILAFETLYVAVQPVPQAVAFSVLAVRVAFVVCLPLLGLVGFLAVLYDIPVVTRLPVALPLSLAVTFTVKLILPLAVVLLLGIVGRRRERGMWDRGGDGTDSGWHVRLRDDGVVVVGWVVRIWVAVGVDHGRMESAGNVLGRVRGGKRIVDEGRVQVLISRVDVPSLSDVVDWLIGLVVVHVRVVHAATAAARKVLASYWVPVVEC